MNKREVKKLASRIAEYHRPNEPIDSWSCCVTCGQHYHGGSENQPMWPCDARRLADAVLELIR